MAASITTSWFLIRITSTLSIILTPAFPSSSRFSIISSIHPIFFLNVRLGTASSPRTFINVVILTFRLHLNLIFLSFGYKLLLLRPQVGLRPLLLSINFPLAVPACLIRFLISEPLTTILFRFPFLLLVFDFFLFPLGTFSFTLGLLLIILEHIVCSTICYRILSLNKEFRIV